MCVSRAARLRPLRTWLSGLAVITDVQVQAGDEEVVGRLLYVKFLKVLAEATAAAAAALAAPECLGPGLLGAGSGWSDLHGREKDVRQGLESWLPGRQRWLLYPG